MPIKVVGKENIQKIRSIRAVSIILTHPVYTHKLEEGFFSALVSHIENLVLKACLIGGCTLSISCYVFVLTTFARACSDKKSVSFC